MERGRLVRRLEPSYILHAETNLRFDSQLEFGPIRERRLRLNRPLHERAELGDDRIRPIVIQPRALPIQNDGSERLDDSDRRARLLLAPFRRDAFSALTEEPLELALLEHLENPRWIIAGAEDADIRDLCEREAGGDEQRGRPPDGVAVHLDCLVRVGFQSVPARLPLEAPLDRVAAVVFVVFQVFLERHRKVGDLRHEALALLHVDRATGHARRDELVPGPYGLLRAGLPAL